MSLCIQTHSLAQGYYKEQPVIKSLDMAVPTGSIYGFLGPNGAGKTTTLKLLLGLIQPNTGEIYILGKSLREHRVEILKSIGSLIESPSIYAHLSAIENLKVWKALYHVTNERIDEVLHLVGLSDTGNKKAGKFSLGMKQRLALATSLLHHPELLILDEPTNGLDPQGIIEMRELLRKLNMMLGVTIVISSHLLSEVEKLVSHLGIIHHGEMKFQGTLSELKTLQHSQQKILWRVSDPTKAMNIIGYGRLEDHGFSTSFIPEHEVAKINYQLMEAQIDIFQVHVQAPDLEKTFLNIIQ